MTTVPDVGSTLEEYALHRVVERVEVAPYGMAYPAAEAVRTEGRTGGTQPLSGSPGPSRSRIGLLVVAGLASLIALALVRRCRTSDR